jgi:DNA polymerase III subunit delta'
VEAAVDKQDITIEQIRELQNFINLGSLRGGRRVVVINGAHKLNSESGNALLKSLEEPPAQVVFFLLSAEPRNILSTIRSRCMILSFRLVPADIMKKFVIKLGVAPEQVEIVTRWSAGKPGLVKRLVDEPEIIERQFELGKVFLSLVKGDGFNQFLKYLESELRESAEAELNARQKALELISSWQGVGRDLLLTKLGLTDSVRLPSLDRELKTTCQRPLAEIIRINKLLNRAEARLSANAHVRLTLEWLGYSVQPATTTVAI